MPVAIVTGAGTGVGQAAAEALLGAGYQVALAGRRTEPLEEVAARWPESTLARSTDVGDEAQVQAAIQKQTGKSIDDLTADELGSLIGAAANKLNQMRQAESQPHT